MRDWIAVCLGGGLGALARYGLLGWVTSSGIPVNVLLINLLGSLFIGIVMALVLEFERGSEQTRLFLAVGIAGGFTTFSTFAEGTYSLLTLAPGRSLLYAGLSLAGGLAAVYAGVIATRLLFRRAALEESD